ncbi:MAG TPA: hypothetical protein VG456_01955 [Candidatus Sulfopaludibacter sp.]|jgi:hypothetical protein|nr:hypothetical protein [Candidatus Sulfopaludibacter sp.]
MKKTLYTLLVCALAATAAFSQTDQKVNLSGTWQIEYHDKNGKEVDTPMITFLQTGGRLEGVFGNKHWRVEGVFAGDQVQFLFHPAGHPEINVRYQGKLDAKGEIRGTMVSEVQSGTFVAVRAPQK